jgi:hypothetical protein
MGGSVSVDELSEDEIETLRKGATGGGLLVALSDRSFFDTFKEAGAMGKHLAEAKKGSDSPLVQRIAQSRGSGFGLVTSPTEVERGTLEALSSAAQLLRTKAPEELEAYRTFVLDLARSVSAAAGGGDHAESAAIGKIEEALGT